MSDKIKNFIEKLWLDSQEAHSRLRPEEVQQKICTKRNTNGEKMFQIDEYSTLNQIKYQIRKIGSKFGITEKQKLITELMENDLE